MSYLNSKLQFLQSFSDVIQEVFRFGRNSSNLKSIKKVEGVRDDMLTLHFSINKFYIKQLLTLNQKKKE
jgi:hypothetical protein